MPMIKEQTQHLINTWDNYATNAVIRNDSLLTKQKESAFILAAKEMEDHISDEFKKRMRDVSVRACECDDNAEWIQHVEDRANGYFADASGAATWVFKDRPDDADEIVTGIECFVGDALLSQVPGFIYKLLKDIAATHPELSMADVAKIAVVRFIARNANFVHFACDEQEVGSGL